MARRNILAIACRTCSILDMLKMQVSQPELSPTIDSHNDLHISRVFMHVQCVGKLPAENLKIELL